MDRNATDCHAIDADPFAARQSAERILTHIESLSRRFELATKTAESPPITTARILACRRYLAGRLGVYVATAKARDVETTSPDVRPDQRDPLQTAVSALSEWTTNIPAPAQSHVAVLIHLSLATACAKARIVVEMRRAFDAPEQFAIGLILDIGRAALLDEFPRSYADNIRASSKHTDQLLTAERRVFGINHTIAGDRIAATQDWPNAWRDAIRFHHRPIDALPTNANDGTRRYETRLAVLIAESLAADGLFDSETAAEIADLTHALGLPPSCATDLLSAVARDVQHLSISWSDAARQCASTRRIAADHAAADPSLSELQRDNDRLQRELANASRLDRARRALAAATDAASLAAATIRYLTRDLGVESAIVLDAGSTDSALLHSAEFDAWRNQIGNITDTADAATTPVLIQATGRILSRLAHAFARPSSRPAWWLPIIDDNHLTAAVAFRAAPAVLDRLAPIAAFFRAFRTDFAWHVKRVRTSQRATPQSDSSMSPVDGDHAFGPSRLDRRLHEMTLALAAGAAHEMNNPLAVIAGRAAHLKRRLTDADVAGELSLIAQKALDCSGILSDLMSALRPTAPQPCAVDLYQMLQELRSRMSAEGLLDASLFRLEIASDTPAVRFDSDHLARVFLDLIHNAVDATDPVTRALTVKAAPDLTEENVVVTLRDNGRGMTPDVLRHAADPFFSDRPAGRGRGLGVTRVRQWLAINGGTIDWRSGPGRGTEVTLRLPIATHADP